MADAVMLDTGPLGVLAHPRADREIVEWTETLALSGVSVIIPEITDYELRRNLLLEGLTRSIARLDQLKGLLMYAPLKMRKARSPSTLPMGRVGRFRNAKNERREKTKPNRLTP